MISVLRTALVSGLVLGSVLASTGSTSERQQIEEDWRKQDGIDTPRVPVTYGVAIGRTLDRGDALLRDLQAQRLPLDAEAVQWKSLRHEWETLSAGAATGGAAWEGLWRRVHALRRRIVFANPLAQVGPLLFIKHVPGIFSHQLTQYYGSCARPGGGLYVLDSPGQSLGCRPLGAGTLPQGSCLHPELSFDGRRVLFAFCRADSTPTSRESHLDRFFHLYEMSVDGTGLRALTDGPFDDFGPRYLPDDRILFTSTRRGGFHRCGRGPCPTYTLTLANADGSHPQPISFHETHEWDPVVLNDGQILYTRWDYVDRHAVFYQQLWVAHPDGTAVSSYYGNKTFNPVGVWEAQPVPGSTRVMATAAAHHAMTAGSIILIDVTRGRDGLEPITRLTPDAPFPESEAPLANLSSPAAWHNPVGIDPSPQVPEEAARWPGHCYRTPHPLSERYFLAAYSFDTLIGEPDPNPAAMFGLYFVDAFGNKELLHRDPEISSLWPVPLRPRLRPAQVASAAESHEPLEGTFFLQDVHRSWPPLPHGSVKQLRIVQVLPKTTWHANDPTVGLANASPGKQVLGTVPVEADGSACFRAPARVPLAFQALDASGEAVQVMRSIVYLQPGETASCVGCHEHRGATPASGRASLALARPPSAITPGPDGSHPLSYPRLVQPVLDQHCVRCHNPARPDGKVVLTGEPEGRYTVSYLALAPRVPFSAWGSKPGDFRVVNSEPLSRPGFFGAKGSSLMQLLRAGHENAVLSSADFERLATWMDANALFYGTFDPADQAQQLLGARIAGPTLE